MSAVARLLVVVAVVVAAVLVMQAATGEATEDAAGLLRPDDAAVVALGATVYETNCASCHGTNLEGQPEWRSPGPDGLLPAPPHDENGHTWHHDDKLLFSLTKYGLAAMLGTDQASAMPAYDGVLSDDEIIAALSYIKSRWPKDVRARHDAMNAAVAN